MKIPVVTFTRHLQAIFTPLTDETNPNDLIAKHRDISGYYGFNIMNIKSRLR